MYERSAIVLEKYFNNICGFDKKINLKTIYKDYKEMVEEIQKYQDIIEEEDKVINEFDEAANDIRRIQQEQKKLYKANIKAEEDRDQLFNSLDEFPESIEKKLKNIEENVSKNNKRLEELREEFINSLTKFSEQQKERNKYSRIRRTEETNHLQIIEKSNKDMNEIDINTLKNLKEFIKSQENDEKEEIIEIMINNGKDERIPFDENVIENATKVRNIIAKKEAECYILIYDRMRKMLSEINNDDIKLDKYNKVLRDVSVKLAFLKAEKMYIVSFLDNERMTAINGLKVHKQLMLDACEKFELDIEQFNNLYELILKEILGKSTKKAYKELYNKEYLKNIEEKEKNFEEETNSIKIKTGTIINSNYWRIEEIKNIYEIFQKEVSEKFEKDLTEFRLEEPEEIFDNNEDNNEINNSQAEDDIFKKEIIDDIVEYIEEYEDDDEDNDYEDDEEYKDDEDDNEEDEDNEDNNDEYEEYDDEDDEEYDDEDDEEYEDDDDEEYEDNDDEEYEDDDDEYEDDNEEYEDNDDEEQQENNDKNIEKPKKDNKKSKQKMRSI